MTDEGAQLEQLVEDREREIHCRIFAIGHCRSHGRTRQPECRPCALATALSECRERERQAQEAWDTRESFYVSGGYFGVTFTDANYEKLHRALAAQPPSEANEPNPYRDDEKFPLNPRRERMGYPTRPTPSEASERSGT